MDVDSSYSGSTNVLKEARKVTQNFKANIDRFKKVDRLSQGAFNDLMKAWKEEREEVDQIRGLSNDILLAPNKQQNQRKMKNWERIQRDMVGKRGKR